MASQLGAGASLTAGQSLVSPNSTYKFVMQSDCLAPVLDVTQTPNFVMSCSDNPPDPGQTGVVCTMETSGILKIILSGTTLCTSSNTSGSSSHNATLNMENDGLIHIRSTTNANLWDSSMGWIVTTPSLLIAAAQATNDQRRTGSASP